MECQPYKLLNASELEKLSRHLQAACDAWSGEWLAGDGIGTVTCCPAAEVGPAILASQTPRSRRSADGAQWLILAGSTAALGEVGRRLIPAENGPSSLDKQSSLLDGVIAAAIEDLLQRLAPGLHSEPSAGAMAGIAEDIAFWRKGSGGAVAELELGASRLFLLLGPQWVAAHSGGRPTAMARAPLVAQRDALDKVRLALEVRVGEVDLELALLQTIGIGDVIQLNTRIDEPMQVQTVDGTPVCKAYLGSQDGHKSIQFTK